tara:strand:- start:14 stop:529 length:516 start_codon:yes stop_codon:yes gene_type:complete
MCDSPLVWVEFKTNHKNAEKPCPVKYVRQQTTSNGSLATLLFLKKLFAGCLGFLRLALNAIYLRLAFPVLLQVTCIFISTGFSLAMYAHDHAREGGSSDLLRKSLPESSPNLPESRQEICPKTGNPSKQATGRNPVKTPPPWRTSYSCPGVTCERITRIMRTGGRGCGRTD